MFKYWNEANYIVRIPEGTRNAEDFYSMPWWMSLTRFADTLVGENEITEFFRYLRRGTFCIELDEEDPPIGSVKDVASHISKFQFQWGGYDRPAGELWINGYSRPLSNEEICDLLDLPHWMADLA